MTFNGTIQPRPLEYLYIYFQITDNGLCSKSNIKIEQPIRKTEIVILKQGVIEKPNLFYFKYNLFDLCNRQVGNIIL